MDIKIAICDDDTMVSDEIENMVQASKFYGENYIIKKYANANDLVSAMRVNKFDIIFLDIELNDNVIGVELASLLKILYEETLIIYISDPNKNIKREMNAEPFGCLVKPIQSEDVEEALGEAEKRIHIVKNAVYVYENKKEKNTLNLNKIIYFYAQSHSVVAVTETDTIVIRKKLDDLEREVKTIYPLFIRVNKRYLINFKYIKKHEANIFHMMDGKQIIKTRKYKDTARDKYIRLIGSL